MKKPFIFLVLGFMLFSLSAYTQESSHHFELGNEAYLAGDYDLAKQQYQQILASGYESAELFYNLGNTHYKLGEIPMAILNYERALRLKPFDEDIKFNLLLANQLITDKIDELPQFFIVKWFQSLNRSVSGKAWSWISILSFFLLLTMVAAVILVRNTRLRKIFVPLALFFFLVTSLSWINARAQYRALNDSNAAIIMRPSVTIKSTPDESGTDLFMLHAGSKVHIQDQVGDWYEVKMADGNQGWLPLEVLEII